MTTQTAAEIVLEALESIALAGMRPSPEMSDNGIQAWHALQAWKFIGIAARALDAAKAPIAQPVPELLLRQAHELGFLRCAGWAQGDDLFTDVDGQTYKKDRDHDLSTIAQPVQPKDQK